MTQIAADAMGLSMQDVEFRLGDSSLPPAPLEGGSATVSSVGSAVQRACAGLRKKLLDAVQQSTAAPFTGSKLETVAFAAAQLGLKCGAHAVPLRDIAPFIAAWAAKAR